MAEESLDCENGYVLCTRCNGDGVGCDLAQVPELNEECSTMQGVKVGSVIEFAQEGVQLKSNTELPEDWPEDWEDMKAPI